MALPSNSRSCNYEETWWLLNLKKKGPPRGQETYDSLTGEKRLKQTHVETNGDGQSFDVFRWQGPSTSAG